MIGAGNVATSMALALCGKCHVAQVYSRHLDNALALAERVGCEATDNLGALAADADFYVVSVVDDAIAEILREVPDNGAVWLHTSGSVPMSVFDGKRKRCGVLYPMQSFTKAMPANMSEVHFFVEGSDPHITAEISEFARLMSSHVQVADSEKIKNLHLAAVFACNFANHMWTLSAEVLEEAGMDFDAMKPLIKTTVEKLAHLSPAESQTGPAQRGDKGIVKSHLAMLSGDKREIYKMLSESIMQRRKNN